MALSNTKYYYPFCSESYWPTAHDAIQQIRKFALRDARVQVYKTYNEAKRVAESTVFDDETWIVVEIDVVDGKAAAYVAPNDGGYVGVEVDSWLLEYFVVHNSNE